MADKKLTKEEVGVIIVGHLQVYAQKVAEVVDDFNAMNGESDMTEDAKRQFAFACMNDVTALTNFLTSILRETMVAGGVSAPPPTQPDATDADVIDLQAYKANGGLLN